MNTDIASKAWCLVMACLLSNGFCQTDTGDIEFRYNYITAPRYSLDGKEFKKTRSDFSIMRFSPEFREEYGKRYEVMALDRGETRHLWANLLGVPGGVLLGLGISEFLFHQNEKNGVRAGSLFTVASLPFLFISTKLDIDSFHSIRDGRKSKKR